MGNSGFAPYTEDDDAYTTRGTPAVRAACRTCSVPVTLFSLAPRGSATDRGTDRMAAWWKMTFAPAAARSTVARSRMSPSTISRVAAYREAKGSSAREPVEKLSRTRTRAPLPEQALDEV